LNEDYKVQKLKVTVLCRVSAKGGSGVYLYIPRNFAEVYEISRAKFVEVEFKKIFRKKYHKDEDEPIDLTPRTINKKEVTKI